MAARPLRLNIPQADLAAPSFSSAEPGALSDWVAELPMAHATQAAKKILQAATEISRLQIDPNARFELLEIIRTPAHYICTRLDRNGPGTPGSSESSTQLAQALQNELAMGYKAVLRDVLSFAELTGPARDLLGHAIHR